ncbi:hypothetical protein COOONC_21603 [Cooperia oncophora]
MNFSSSAILRMPLNRDMKRLKKSDAPDEKSSRYVSHLRSLANDYINCWVIIRSYATNNTTPTRIVRHRDAVPIAIKHSSRQKKIDILAECSKKTQTLHLCLITHSYLLQVSNPHAQKQSVDRLLVVPGKLAVPALYTTQILSLMVNLKQVHKIWTSVRRPWKTSNIYFRSKAIQEKNHAENCPANPHNHVRRLFPKEYFSKILTANNTCDQATMNSNSTTPKQSKKSNSSTPKQSKIPVSTTPTSVCRGHGSFTASTISSAIKSATQKSKIPSRKKSTRTIVEGLPSSSRSIKKNKGNGKSKNIGFVSRGWIAASLYMEIA